MNTFPLAMLSINEENKDRIRNMFRGVTFADVIEDTTGKHWVAQLVMADDEPIVYMAGPDGAEIAVTA
jgi:hypothetical protein